jgi:toxin ParE1/3/4
VHPAAVRFHLAAAQEAEAAYTWYAERSESAAHGFREELRRAVEAVTEAPERWPRYGAHTRRYLFPRFPFSLVYRLRGGEVEVIAVAQGKRRPGYWRSRTPEVPQVPRRPCRRRNVDAGFPLRSSTCQSKASTLQKRMSGKALRM